METAVLHWRRRPVSLARSRSSARPSASRRGSLLIIRHQTRGAHLLDTHNNSTARVGLRRSRRDPSQSNSIFLPLFCITQANWLAPGEQATRQSGRPLGASRASLSFVLLIRRERRKRAAAVSSPPANWHLLCQVRPANDNDDDDEDDENRNKNKRPLPTARAGGSPLLSLGEGDYANEHNARDELSPADGRFRLAGEKFLSLAAQANWETGPNLVSSR
jgi:hypothetical protein